MIWLVALASLCTLTLTSGIFFSFFAVFKPLQYEFAWAGTELVVAFVVSIAVAGGLVTITRRLAGSLGFRLTVSAAVLLLGLGCILFMPQTASFWQLLFGWGIVVGLGFGSCIASATSALGAWFPKRRWIRYSTIAAGIVLGILTVPLTSNVLIAEWGWRLAYVLIGRAALLLLFPAVIILIIANILKRDRSY